MPELVPVEGDPFLQPVEGDPFELGLKSDEGSMRGVVGDVGKHADWAKFEREVRPSENVEDVRGRRQVPDPIEAIGQFLDKAAQYGEPQSDPSLQPVEGDPFAPEGTNVSAVGPAADALGRLGQYFAHRLMQRLSGPASAMQPVEPEKPGMWSDIDEVHRMAADEALTHWAGEAAMGTIRR